MRHYVAFHDFDSIICGVGPMVKRMRMDNELILETQAYAEANHRSIPKQIEHWAQIGRIAEDNPDLTYDFIRDAILATAEIKSGATEPYVCRKRK